MAPHAIIDPTECTFCHAVIPSADRKCEHCGWEQEKEIPQPVKHEDVESNRS